jgi:hydrogenase/urease accessory protein HupE
LADQFLRFGVEHILTGYDHLLFVAALVLATLTLWDLIKIVTAFTLAHTLTLFLATFNLVRLSSMIVEPMIAASIVFVAVQNIFWPKLSRGRSRLLIAFSFGLFHGLGFAGGLLEAMQGMTLQSVWVALLSFSLGVELGHQIVVLPLFIFLFLVRRKQFKTKKLNSSSLFIQRVGSFAIGVAGFYFLLQSL